MSALALESSEGESEDEFSDQPTLEELEAARDDEERHSALSRDRLSERDEAAREAIFASLADPRVSVRKIKVAINEGTKMRSSFQSAGSRLRVARKLTLSSNVKVGFGEGGSEEQVSRREGEVSAALRVGKRWRRRFRMRQLARELLAYRLGYLWRMKALERQHERRRAAIDEARESVAFQLAARWRIEVLRREEELAREMLAELARKSAELLLAASLEKHATNVQTCWRGLVTGRQAVAKALADRELQWRATPQAAAEVAADCELRSHRAASSIQSRWRVNSSWRMEMRAIATVNAHFVRSAAPTPQVTEADVLVIQRHMRGTLTRWRCAALRRDSADLGPCDGLAKTLRVAHRKFPLLKHHLVTSYEMLYYDPCSWNVFGVHVSRGKYDRVTTRIRWCTPLGDLRARQVRQQGLPTVRLFPAKGPSSPSLCSMESSIWADILLSLRATGGSQVLMAPYRPLGVWEYGQVNEFNELKHKEFRHLCLIFRRLRADYVPERPGTPSTRALEETMPPMQAMQAKHGIGSSMSWRTMLEAQTGQDAHLLLRSSASFSTLLQREMSRSGGQPLPRSMSQGEMPRAWPKISHGTVPFVAAPPAHPGLPRPRRGAQSPPPPTLLPPLPSPSPPSASPASSRPLQTAFAPSRRMQVRALRSAGGLLGHAMWQPVQLTRPERLGKGMSAGLDSATAPTSSVAKPWPAGAPLSASALS